MSNNIYIFITLLFFAFTFLQRFINQGLIERVKSDLLKKLESFKNNLEFSRSEQIRFSEDKRQLFIEAYTIVRELDIGWQKIYSTIIDKKEERVQMDVLEKRNENLQEEFLRKSNLFSLYAIPTDIYDNLIEMIEISNYLFTIFQNKYYERQNLFN